LACWRLCANHAAADEAQFNGCRGGSYGWGCCRRGGLVGSGALVGAVVGAGGWVGAVVGAGVAAGAQAVSAKLATQSRLAPFDRVDGFHVILLFERKAFYGFVAVKHLFFQ